MGRKARLKQTRGDDPQSIVAPSEAVTSAWSGRDWTIIAILVVITFAVFGPVTSHAFLNYDDGQFIYENAHVLNGDIGWALTSAEIGWYPLTWLSHMLDVKLWGLNAGMHLITGVLLHAISAILLFLALHRMTRAPWESAFVAALFAIHPMHVESVAWASERKDTLSTVFAMLALWLYARAPRRMLGVSIALTLSLAAKQMYITLPFIFLLLDLWPLDRLKTLDDLRRRIVEKWPLFVLAIGGVLAAFIGQRNLKAVQTTTSLPTADRVANALVAYVAYLRKLIVPIDMALPYPLTRMSFMAAIVPLIMLIAITVAVLVSRRRAPYLVVGWSWFVVTLMPVIGIIAIGNQSMADRYTYFSYIGLFIAIAFGTGDLARMRIPKLALATAAVAVIVVCSVVASHQLRFWKDSETLFTHTLAVTRDNSVAEYTLGQTLQASKPDEAIPHLQRAIALTQPLLALPNARRPDWYPQAFVGLGTAMLTKAGALAQSPARDALIRDAVANYRQALAVDPDAPHAKHNLEVAVQMMPTASTLPRALQADYDAYLNEGTAYSQQGQYDEAISEFRHALALAPLSIEPHIYLALGLLQANQRSEGLAELRAAKSIDATQANEMLTKALHLPANAHNLDGVIAQASQ
jgi:tetratricopeptide (TPR) repeat protein